MSISTLLPTKWRHRIMRRAQKWVHLHTWLKKMKTVSFNNTLGGSRHSWFRCHAPNIGDRRRARLYAGWKDEAVVSVSKTGQKKDQNKGEGRVLTIQLDLCADHEWEPVPGGMSDLLKPFCHFCVHSQRGLRMIVSGQSWYSTKVGVAPKTSPQEEVVLTPSLCVSAWTTSSRLRFCWAASAPSLCGPALSSWCLWPPSPGP